MASARFRGEVEDVAGAVADVGVVAVVVEAVGLPEEIVLETVFSGLGLKLWRRAIAALLLLVLVAVVAVEFWDVGRFASSCCCRCCGCCCDAVLRCVAVVVVVGALAVAAAAEAPVAGLLLIPRCGTRNLLSCVCVLAVDDVVSRTELWRCGSNIDFLRFKALSFAAVEAGAFVAVRVTLELELP